MNTLKKILRYIVDLLAPEDKKISTLLKLSSFEMRAALPSSKILFVRNLYPLFDYSNKAVKTIVWSIKYRRNRSMLERVSKYLSEEIENALADILLFEPTDKRPLLTAIPMSKERFREKGFNQGEDLCILIAKSLPFLEYIPILSKIRETKRQTKLPKKERLFNVVGSFAVKNQEKIKNRLVIVVDDVHTTGATFGEVEKILKKAGAKKTLGFFIAH